MRGRHPYEHEHKHNHLIRLREFRDRQKFSPVGSRDETGKGIQQRALPAVGLSLQSRKQIDLKYPSGKKSSPRHQKGDGTQL